MSLLFGYFSIISGFLMLTSSVVQEFSALEDRRRLIGLAGSILQWIV